MAEGSLPLAPSDASIVHMLETITKERDDVGNILRREVEKLMRLGADTCGMTYVCSSSNTPRPCTQPKNMRLSYTQNDSLMNLKRIHWMFHELPGSLHQDVLMHRMSHMDVITRKVMWELNVIWGEKRVGEEAKRSNCIEKLYCRILNEKKNTIVNPEKTKNKRTPFVRHPQTKAKSGNHRTYRMGMTEFYWKSPTKGGKVVKLTYRLDSAV
jgi:hypothetical protein